MTHHKFTPLRWSPITVVDGRMVVADENEWQNILHHNGLIKEDLEYHGKSSPFRVLIGAEVFGEYTSTDMLRTANGEWARWDTSEWKQYAVSGHAYLNCADVLNRLFRLIDDCQQVMFCVETEQPDNIYRKLPVRWYQGELTPVMTPPPNFWLGVGPIRTQADADRLIPELLKVPAALHYGVFQPTEEIDLLKDNGLRGWDYLRGWNPDAGDEGANTSRIGWLIIRGDEQPMHPDHVRSLVKQGESARVPCWLEWGEWVSSCQKQCVGGFHANGKRIEMNDIDYDGTNLTKTKTESKSGRWKACFKVGRERSGSTLDGREYKMVPERG